MELVERLKARDLAWDNSSDDVAFTADDALLMQDAAAELERITQHRDALAAALKVRTDELFPDLQAEIKRLRDGIKKAHAALTKSSLEPAERVFDATAVLSKVCGLPFHVWTSGGSEPPETGVRFDGETWRHG